MEISICFVASPWARPLISALPDSLLLYLKMMHEMVGRSFATVGAAVSVAERPPTKAGSKYAETMDLKCMFFSSIFAELMPCEA
jgi:hypothetical protein